MFPTTTPSTTRSCFVCNSSVNLSSNTFDSVLQNFELCHRYIVLVSRYLNITGSNNTNNPIKPKLSLNTKSENWTLHLKPMDKDSENYCCCDGCLPILKAFCKMYDKWTRLKLRLYGNAQTVANLLEHNQKQVFGHPGSVEKFKREFASKVQKLPTHEFPRLWLPKMQPLNKMKCDEAQGEIQIPGPSTCRIVSPMSPKENIVIQRQEVEVTDSSTGKNLFCNTCGKRFAHASSLYQHRVIHKEVKRYSCCFCERKFHLKGNLIAHERIHTGEKPYICGVPDCRKRFSQVGNCRTHQWARHKIYRNGPIIKNFGKTQAGKNKNSNRTWSLDDILENALQNEAPPLITNNDQVQALENLIDVEDDDSVVVISPTNSQKSISKKIIQNTESQSEINDQKPKHTEKLPILMVNSSAHTSKIPFTQTDNPDSSKAKTRKCWVCNICCKQFNNGQSLYYHRRVTQRSQVKRFSCIFCERKYYQKSNLITHMRTHTREEPYVCGIRNCQESFKQQSLCRNHQRRKHNVYEVGAIKGYKKNQTKMVPRNLLAERGLKTTVKTESRPETEVDQPGTIKFDGSNATVKVEVDEDDDVIFIPPPNKYEVTVHPTGADMIPGSAVSAKFDLNCLEQELDLLD